MRPLAGCILLLALTAADAEAGRGGGRGGGHGGGGHHAGGGSKAHTGHSSGRGHFHAHGSSCEETSEVLGYRKCSRFGRWSETTFLPPTTLHLATTARVLRLAPVSMTGDTELENANLAYQAERRTDASMSAVGVALRLAMDMGAGFYLGLEGEVGGALHAARVPTMTSSAETVVSRQDRYGQFLFLLGARRSYGDWQGAVELGAGVQAVSLTARYADDPASGSEHEATLGRSLHAAIEPRVRIDRWLTPWITAGAFVGAQLDLGTARGGYVGGLQLGFHLRAFDANL